MTKYSVLSAAGTDNPHVKSNNIIFTVKDGKLCPPVVTLSARNNQKLSKRFSKGFERRVYWNEYKTKNENKNRTNEYRYFFESNFVGANRLFVLVYTNQDAHAKRFKAKIYYVPKGIIDNYNVIISGKNLYDQTIDSDIKRYKEIRKLKTGQGEDYTTVCLLYYVFIKSHYILIAVDLSRQKELDTDPKAVQQLEFVRQLKILNDVYHAADACNYQSMFILTILEKINGASLKFSQGSVTLLQKKWKIIIK